MGGDKELDVSSSIVKENEFDSMQLASAFFGSTGLSHVILGTLNES